MSREWLLLCALSFGCPSTPAPSDPASTAPAVTEPSKPAWWPLTVMPEFEYDPQPIDPSTLPPPPERLIPGPAEWVSPGDGPMTYDMGPTRLWAPFELRSCQPEWPVAEACGFVEEDARGERVGQGRREGGQLTVHTLESGLLIGVKRCCDSAAGNEVEVLQVSREHGELFWDLYFIRRGFDERGNPVFMQSFTGRAGMRKDGTEKFNYDSMNGEYVTYIYDEQGRPRQSVQWWYQGDRGPNDDHARRYEWDADDRLVRVDNFQGSDSVFSNLQYWYGDYMQAVWASRTTWGHGNERQGRLLSIYRMFGRNKYERVFQAPEAGEQNMRWESVTADNIETVTEYKDDLAVVRRRYELVDASGQPTRRLLTVERRVPDVEGLAVVERWRYELDRVVVERTAGRTTYLFDCSDMQPLEDDFDPDSPPPSRGMPTREEVGVMLERLAARRARDEAEKRKYEDE